MGTTEIPPPEAESDMPGPLSVVTRSLSWLTFTLPVFVLAACETPYPTGTGGGPAAPRNFDAYYYDRAVHLTWDLPPSWDGEVFRVWGKRESDSQYLLIAEVTSCADGSCGYSDRNVVPEVTYVYYVSAVDTYGVESPSDEAIEVRVPRPTPPPVPDELDAIPLDASVFVAWSAKSRDAEDFSFYRVYLEGGEGSVVFLGETDSEGFLDLRVENGNTYGYFVTAVDREGHESEGSELVEGSPRPDFHGELLYAHEDRPDVSGFRFQESGDASPIVSGNDQGRHFRLEFDGMDWWLEPGPGIQVANEAHFTTALRCGPGADPGCLDVRWAPESGYGSVGVVLVPENAYTLRVPAEGGQWRYGLVRVSHLGFAQDGAIAIFDWAYQLQPGNPSLVAVPN
jgi:hypothetical protein